MVCSLYILYIGQAQGNGQAQDLGKSPSKNPLQWFLGAQAQDLGKRSPARDFSAQLDKAPKTK